MPPYLRPMAPTAADAILCGDPARALTIAQDLLTEPRMSNHNRGLWGYFGSLPNGSEMTVQATGIGGTSAAIVLEALAERGLRRAVRVGSATSRAAEPQAGSLIAVSRVWARDGASAAYGAAPDSGLAPDPTLTTLLAAGCRDTAELVSLSRPPLGGRDPDEPGAGAGTLYDMQSAALLAAAKQAGVEIGIGVVVTRNSLGPLEDDPHEAASIQLGRTGAAALAGRRDHEAQD
jgi:uridine phosphorylase